VIDRNILKVLLNSNNTNSFQVKGNNTPDTTRNNEHFIIIGVLAGGKKTQTFLI